MTGARESGWRALLDAGYTARLELVADVAQLRAEDGERMLRIRMAGGLHLDVLLDHGLDLGPAWFRGIPVSWRSPNPVDPGPGADWESRFRGGLMVTCGPDNIGEPRGAHGQHGRHHGTPAFDVQWWREVRDREVVVVVRGSVAHTSLGGPRLIVERQIELSTGSGQVTVYDAWTNVGAAPAGLALLYHVNLGAPLLQAGGRVVVPDRQRTRTREPLPAGRSALEVPAPSPDHSPVVAEHRSNHWEESPEWARAELRGPQQEELVTVSWTAATLPRLVTWNFPQRGTWVMGIEPANAPLFGEERALPWAGAPVLDAGGRSELGLRICVA